MNDLKIFLVGILKFQHETYKSSDKNSIENYVYEKAYFCGFDMVCLSKTAKREIVLLTFSKVSKYVITARVFVDEEGEQLLHLMNKEMLTHYMSVVFLKGHPLFEEFNRHLMMLKETGFVEYFYSELEYLNTKSNARFQYRKKNLGFAQILALMQFFVVANCVSFLVFLIEVMWAKNHK